MLVLVLVADRCFDDSGSMDGCSARWLGLKISAILWTRPPVSSVSLFHPRDPSFLAFVLEGEPTFATYPSFRLSHARSLCSRESAAGKRGGFSGRRASGLHLPSLAAIRLTRKRVSRPLTSAPVLQAGQGRIVPFRSSYRARRGCCLASAFWRTWVSPFYHPRNPAKVSPITLGAEHSSISTPEHEQKSFPSATRSSNNSSTPRLSPLTYSCRSASRQASPASDITHPPTLPRLL